MTLRTRWPRAGSTLGPGRTTAVNAVNAVIACLAVFAVLALAALMLSPGRRTRLRRWAARTAWAVRNAGAWPAGSGSRHSGRSDPAGAAGDADPAEDAENARRVDELFAGFTRGAVPGCAVAVAQDGKVAFARGYGLADLARRTPITPRTVFDIASTSKQFTAACVLLLAQRGRLSLADDVRRYVPELPPYTARITLDELLHHTGGLPDYVELLAASGRRYQELTTDADALAVLAAQPAPLFAPGTEYKYSDTGYFLLSLVVQRVTGRTLRDFAAENFFGPLGMRDTAFLDDLSRLPPGRATAYSPAPGGGFQIDQSNWQQTGDGAVNTTVLDLVRWDANFESAAVGGRRLIAALLTPGTLADGSPLPSAYGGGLMLDTYRGLQQVHHAGSWCGYRSELLRLPERRLAVATLCNTSAADPTALSQQVADVYLDPE
jgi:CubicO group peptidase (beta-lactamase class C family)